MKTAMPMRIPTVRGAADAPTSVMIQALDGLELGARPLVVDESSGWLAAAIDRRGAAAQTWRRFVAGIDMPAPWPEVADCNSALVRLGKDRRALAMALDAAASVVAPGGAMVLFGANAEGIKSAAKALEVVAEGVVTIDTRRHSRVLAGKRRAEIAALRGALAAWREVHEVTFAGRTRLWVGYPGVFAGGGLDPGTAMLLDHLPVLEMRRDGAAILDLACGSGIIAAAARERYAGAHVDGVDADAVAVEAAHENVPDMTVICGDGLDATPRARYDAILSNPPLHEGVDENLGFLERLIRDAPGRLGVGGILQVVIPSRIRAMPWFEAAFAETTIVAQDRRYQIVRGTKGAARATRRGAR